MGLGEWYAAVDLGGTTMAAAVGTAHGEVVSQGQVATRGEEGPEAVLERMAALVRKLAEGKELAAVGVGIPGLVDRERGETKFLPNLATNWRGVPAAARLRESLGVPAYLLNDARLAALGELHFGHGRDTADFVFVTLGTGIGGGVVSGGRLVLGALGAAGEVGHQTIVVDGPVCGCGNRGCLEALVSASALSRRAAEIVRRGEAPILAATLRQEEMSVKLLAASGEAAVQKVLADGIAYLGVGIANLVTILHPDLVVLGGGLTGLGERLFEPLRAIVKERVRMFPVDGLRIEQSRTGENAALLGGLALARERGRI
jgi:glucokinase